MPKVKVSIPCYVLADAEFEVDSEEFDIVSGQIDAETAERVYKSGAEMKIHPSKFINSPDFKIAIVSRLCDDCGQFIRGVADCCDDCEAKRLKDHVERQDTEDAARSPNF